MSATDESRRMEFEHSSVQMTVRSASLRLRSHLAQLECYEEDARRPYWRSHFAMPRVAILVELGEPLAVQGSAACSTGLRAPGGFVAGLSDGPAATRHGGRHCGVQIDLSPLAARQLFDVPLSEMRGRAVALVDLLPRELRDLCEHLGETGDASLRLDRIERFLVDRLATAEQTSPRVAAALARIEALGGRLDVGSLAPWLGISQKHLIALFHDHVGVSPKLFARLVRHESALGDARAHPELNWAAIALRNGYCDQSHFNREVRAFTATTPTALRSNAAGTAQG